MKHWVIGMLTLVGAAAQDTPLPPDTSEARDALESSPRQSRSRWVEIERDSGVPLRAFLVEPDGEGPAGVVVLIHGIYGLDDWVRAAADRVAAAGFIALAPDFISGKGPGGGGYEAVADRDGVALVMRSVTPREGDATIATALELGSSLPRANGATAVIGFCWGGSASFRFATLEPELDAAVVFYGTSPETEALAKIAAPVLGLYGGDDERVNATIEPARAEMSRLGKTFESAIYDGAGHAFLQRQTERDGANRRAAEQAWPRAMEFLRRHASAERNGS